MSLDVVTRSSDQMPAAPPLRPSGRMVSRRGRFGAIALTVGVGLLAILWMSPLYFVAVNSLKDFGSVISNAASLPSPIVTDNFVEAWEAANFARALINSVVVTTVSVTGLVVLGAMAAWRIVRTPSRTKRVIFFAFVAAMIIPFQTVMIPMVQVSAGMNLLDNRLGLVVLYLSFGMPLTVFFLHGFARSSVPVTLEEAAVLDGATSWQTFRHVVFPILRPAVATVAILHTFWIWNDFLLPLLVIFDPDKRTIPLAVFSFFGVHSDQWNLALATLVMGMVPIIVFFLLFQRFIIEGVAAGSLKG